MAVGCPFQVPSTSTLIYCMYTTLFYDFARFRKIDSTAITTTTVTAAAAPTVATGYKVVENRKYRKSTN